ncbi:MAG TPA: hypothetical protein VF156_07045, partial [Agromyces sp.]
TTDVDDIVIGGGLAALGARLLDGTRGVLAEWAAGSAFLASLDLPGRVQVIPRGFPAAAVGAALVGEELESAEESDDLKEEPAWQRS